MAQILLDYKTPKLVTVQLKKTAGWFRISNFLGDKCLLLSVFDYIGSNAVKLKITSVWSHQTVNLSTSLPQALFPKVQSR